MQIAAERAPGREETVQLYDSVGWSGYTNDPEKLMRSLARSHLVLTARDSTGRLVGLARTISDGETVCYLQDLIVHPDAQRGGIGRRLMAELLGRYDHCRFFVLTTDSADSADARKSHPFYRAMGLIPHEEQGMAAFARPINR